jgi:hypothetical protein
MNTKKKNYKKKLKMIEKLENSYDEEDEFIVEQEEDEEETYPYEEPYVEEEEEDELDEVENKKTKKPKEKIDKTKFYVDPKDFDTKIMEYYESGVLSNELAEMVSKIAHKLSYANNFINYSYREEMVGDGIIRMFKALMSKKYNHTKGTNPFSYFTRIAFNAFRNRIKKEKHMRETHEKYKNEFLMFSEGYNSMVKNNKNRITKIDG